MGSALNVFECLVEKTVIPAWVAVIQIPRMEVFELLKAICENHGGVTFEVRIYELNQFFGF